MQGTIIKYETVNSNGKRLEYFLLDSQAGREYCIVAVSHQENDDRYALVPHLSGPDDFVARVFDRIVCGTVCPETLGEILHDLIT